MKRLDVRAIGGILLILVGILLLLQNIGILVGVVALIWALIFGVGGLVFLYMFLTNRTQWWAVIPGFALLGLAALIALDEFFPRVGEALGGMIFLGGVGLAFWVIYFVKREQWWAIIPGGTLFTLALVAGLESVFEGAEMGGVFFLGLGLTFAAHEVGPHPRRGAGGDGSADHRRRHRESRVPGRGYPDPDWALLPPSPLCERNMIWTSKNNVEA